MKSKFRLLSILSAVVIGATTGLTACQSGGVEEHDHVWNGGEITKQATCHSEGVKTYACTVEGCTQTKTEPVSMTAHSWNGGEETIKPACNNEGEKTFTCTNEGCTQTKTEPIGKTDHRWNDGELSQKPDFYNNGEMTYTCLDCGTERTESVRARADFSEQYYTSLTEQTGWLYGYAKSYDTTSGAIDFVRIEQTDAESGTWKAEGAEISKGRVSSQNNAVIAYRFTDAVPESTQAEISVSFEGEETATALNARIFVTDRDGGLKFSAELNAAGDKNWSYTSQEADAQDVEQGDTYYLVLENKGTGKPAGALSYTLTAPCIHVWNSGAVKEPATCKQDGVMEYTCLNCSAKREGKIDKTEHGWNGGEITKQPTETDEGIMTYTCTVCGETKTEYIPRLGSSEFNGADFAADFSTVAQPEWKYGYTNNFNFENNTFAFKELKPFGEAWEDNGGIEIKSGWLKNETDGAQAVVRYIMPQSREVNISLNFKGSDGVTRITGRLHILNPDGSVQSCDFIDGTQSDKWEFNKKVTLEKGSAVSVIFFNEGSAGWYHGAFSMKLTAEGQAQPGDKEIANFFKDFSTEGNNGWVYGYATEYDWGNNNFKFNSLTANAENGEWSGTEGLCVKADWVLVEGQGADLAVGYKVPAGQDKLNVAVDFVGTNADETRIAARIIAVGADGNTKSAEFISAGTKQASWNATHTVAVADGDTVYVVLFREPNSGWAQGKLQVVINGKAAEQPAPEFTGANFAEDFSTEGNNGWVYGYASDYNWDNNNFKFNALTKQNADEWGGCSGMIIKRDWILSEWTEENQGNANLAVGYKVPAGQSKLKVAVTFDHAPASETDGVSPTRFSTRILVVGADGNTKSMEFINKDASSWNAEHTVEVADGDTVYVVLFREKGDWAQGKLQITIEKA